MQQSAIPERLIELEALIFHGIAGCYLSVARDEHYCNGH